jgi:hypothetical protein
MSVGMVGLGGSPMTRCWSIFMMSDDANGLLVEGCARRIYVNFVLSGGQLNSTIA